MTHPLEGTRIARAEIALQLRSEGLLQREIAAEMGISRTYASELLTDPTGEIQKARKDSYSGVCEACGGPTSGSEGPAKVARFCVHCASWQTRGKWDKDTVIDAIQRFAAANGRPPKADEWIRADPENGYPPRTAVYDSQNGKRNAPFDSWADAIEAAGYARPHVGVKHAKLEQGGEPMGASLERRYIVFSVNEEGDREIAGMTMASSGQQAVLDVAPTQEGLWESVPEVSLTRHEFVVKPTLQRVAKR